MKNLVIVLLILSRFLADSIPLNGNNQNSRNLVLTEQELRFAGNALKTVLASNINSFRRKSGTRRFSGTFTIVEKENQCGDFDIRINADVEFTNGNTNMNGKRYPNNNYPTNNNNNYSPSNNFGNNAPGNVGAGGYAGQFNY